MKKSTKTISIILAIVMVISAIPFFSFAASPSVTLKANRTTIKAGDEVVVTVSLSDNSNLGNIEIDLNYDNSAFEVISTSYDNLFEMSVINQNLKNKVRFVAVSSTPVTKSCTLFTVSFRTLKAVDSEMNLSITEACDGDFNEVSISTNRLSFKGFVEEPTIEPSTEEPTTNYNTPYITLSTDRKDVKTGDKVTVTASISANSGLGTLTADLVYDASAFKVTNMTASSDAVSGAFVNSNFVAGKARYSVATAGTIEKSGTLFTVELEALKAIDSKVYVAIDEACDDDYNMVKVSSNTLYFYGNNYDEPTTEYPTEKPTEKPSEEPTTEWPTYEDPCKNGHDYSKPMVVTKPTCKKAGVSQKTCKVCGDKVEEAIPATGKCEPGAWKVVKPATTTEYGEKVQECKYCGEVLQRAKIAKLPSDPTEPSIPSDDNENNDFFIQEPSRTTIRNRDRIVLHVNPQLSLPKGSYIVWKYKNSNFDVEEAENGMKLIATAEDKGWTVFTATLYDVDGNVLATDSVELYSKSGLFDKIRGFFRKMFGATKIYEN